MLLATPGIGLVQKFADQAVPVRLSRVVDGTIAARLFETIRCRIVSPSALVLA